MMLTTSAAWMTCFLLGASRVGATTVYVAVTNLGESGGSVRKERVKEKSTRRVTFGLYIRAVGDKRGSKPIGIKRAWVTATGSCRMVTRDLTGNLQDIKQYSDKLFNQHSVKFKLNGKLVKDKGGPRSGRQIILTGPATKVNPKKRYYTGTKGNGKPGETWTGIAIELERNGNKCDLCTVTASIKDEYGRKKSSKPFTFRLADRWCPGKSKYLVNRD
mmetsp:Transcript_17431/g.54448  ORF Transcript_17431/g.54448 Transcript_17431/m.54448 type:complete len:217 (+) Transcript_17431:49-699(+)